MKIANIILATGEIVGVSLPTSLELAPSDGEIQGVNLFKHIPLDSDNIEYITLKYWDGTNFASRIAKPSPYHIWKEGVWDLDRVTLRNKIRKLRHTKLRSCDWTQLLDFPGPAPKQAEWVTYRAAIRDILNSHPDPQTIDEIIWPTPPE